VTVRFPVSGVFSEQETRNDPAKISTGKRKRPNLRFMKQIASVISGRKDKINCDICNPYHVFTSIIGCFAGSGLFPPKLLQLEKIEYF
jgi:hypothetical protein